MSIRIHWTVWYGQCRYEAFILTMLAFYVRLCLVVVINNNLMSIFITRYAVIVITNKCCCGDHIDNDRMLQCSATKNNNRQKLDLADVLWGIVETIFLKKILEMEINSKPIKLIFFVKCAIESRWNKWERIGFEYCNSRTVNKK